MKAFKAFIKFEDVPKIADFKNSKDFEKVGSYIILSNPIPITTSVPLFKEVLNNICFNVSTL